MNKNYKAIFAFPAPGDDSRERSMDIIFAAPTGREAILAALRFFNTRQEAVPDYFKKLYAIKVMEFTPHVIDADGRFFQAEGKQVFEWKCDWLCPVETFIPEEV